MNWKGIFHVIGKAVSDNRPAVLFAGGVVCMGACAFLTARTAPRVKETYYDIVDHREVLTEKETAMAVWRGLVVPYIPATVAGIASVTSFALSNRELSKKAAGAAVACAVAERALGAYQDNVIKELGEEVNERILHAMADDVPDDIMEMSRGYIRDDELANRFPHEINDKLYYDHVTGRIFYSSDEKIKDAESTVNKLLIDTGIATVNDFYSALLLDCDSVVGDAIGWRVDDAHARNMDVIFGSRLDRENNLPMVTIGYRTCAVNLRELERR